MHRPRDHPCPRTRNDRRPAARRTPPLRGPHDRWRRGDGM